jgi:hypothetical protein
MHHSGAERRENVEVRASLFEIEPTARRPGQASGSERADPAPLCRLFRLYPFRCILP